MFSQPLGFLPPPYSAAVCSLQRPSAFSDAELVKQLDSVTSILDCTEGLSNRAGHAVSRLKQALIELEVRQIKQKAIAQGIWDFYPTPDAVIEKMIAIAKFQPHHRVLEPSAGSGDLVKAISLKVGVRNIDCFEIHPLLRQAIELQQFDLIGMDFLISSPNPIYDRVLVNPPFGNNGVANHTIHAYNFLKPGGRLITLAHHYRLKPSHSDKQFFDWLESHDSRFLNLGTAFKKSNRTTNIPVQLIVIDKPRANI